MSVKLTRRVASELLKRGESAVKIKPDALKDAEKAITREDVRNLIKSGNIYATKAKHNISAYSKVLREKRKKGRRRGMGRRKRNAQGSWNSGIQEEDTRPEKGPQDAQNGEDNRQREIQEVLCACEGRQFCR